MKTIELAQPAGSRAAFRHDYANPDGRAVRLYSHDREAPQPIAPFLDSAAQATELRWHPLRQDWSVYAPARQNRTFQPASSANPLAPPKPGEASSELPFADWEVAIFDNRFPSFGAQGGPKHAPVGVTTAAARGACEVIVYGPEAEGSLATLSQLRRELLVAAWADRYVAHYDAGAAYVLPFENRGAAVGATLPHPHGQIYALPVVPLPQARAAEAFANGYDLAAQLPAWQQDYAIAEAGGVLAYAPPYARFPYETWLAPFAPRRGPWEFSKDEVQGFAALLGEMVARYDALFGEPMPMMLTLHAAPREAGTFHFSAQFYPLLRSAGRLKYLASVEQATGLFTVDVMPEVTAKLLREAAL